MFELSENEKVLVQGGFENGSEFILKVWVIGGCTVVLIKRKWRNVLFGFSILCVTKMKFVLSFKPKGCVIN